MVEDDESINGEWNGGGHYLEWGFYSLKILLETKLWVSFLQLITQRIWTMQTKKKFHNNENAKK